MEQEIRAKIEQHILSGVHNVLSEREIGQQLRKLPAQKRYEVIKWVINRNVRLGLSLARNSINKPNHLGDLLVQGLEQAEGENIKIWLDALLGPQCSGPMATTKLFHVLQEILVKQPHIVENVLHYLPNYISPGSDICQRSLCKLGYKD